MGALERGPVLPAAPILSFARFAREGTLLVNVAPKVERTFSCLPPRSPPPSAPGVGQTIAALECVEESPGSMGKVPGNAWGARAHGKCNRKQTACLTFAGEVGKGEMVR